MFIPIVPTVYFICFSYMYHLVESGILSDISVTPDQDHTHPAEQLTGHRGSWSTLGAAIGSSASASNSTVILRRYKSYAHAAESAAPESK